MSLSPSTKNQESDSLYSLKRGMCTELLVFWALDTNSSEQNSRSSCFHGGYLFIRQHTNTCLLSYSGKCNGGIESDRWGLWYFSQRVRDGLWWGCWSRAVRAWVMQASRGQSVSVGGSSEYRGRAGGWSEICEEDRNFWMTKIKINTLLVVINMPPNFHSVVAYDTFPMKYNKAPAVYVLNQGVRGSWSAVENGISTRYF